jgi:hypothetical protein
VTDRRPIVDEAVKRSPGLGVAGLALVIAALGLAVLGARYVSSTLRGLDQQAPSVHIPEPSRTTER